MDLIRITQLEWRGELKLKLVFSDGLSGVLDFSDLLTGPIFSPLKKVECFSTAQVNYGTVVWEYDIDMAPEYLHLKMLEQGVELNHLSKAGRYA